jgi:hypothetical protein
VIWTAICPYGQGRSGGRGKTKFWILMSVSLIYDAAGTVIKFAFIILIYTLCILFKRTINKWQKEPD